MDNPLISAVITTYKRRAEQISRAVYSVLNQTYENLELIIVDDSPSDYQYRSEVEKFCAGLSDSRVSYVQHEKNMGACAARNTGIDRSRGEYVAFLDDDDEWDKRKLELLYNVFAASDKKLGLVYSDAVIHEADGRTRKNFDRYTPHRGFVYKELSCDNFIGSTSFPLINRDALIAAGKFDPKMPASQDWETWLRICEKYEVDYIEDALTHYYIHEGERITSDTIKRLNGLFLLDEKQKELLDTNPDVKCCRLEYELRLYIDAGMYAKAVKCYADIVKAKPSRVVKNIVNLKAFLRIFIKRRKGSH